MAQTNTVYEPDSDEKPVQHGLPDSDRPAAMGDSSDPRSAYNPQSSPMGDSSDPRGGKDPQTTPKGDYSDPRGDLQKAEQGAGEDSKSGGSSDGSASSETGGGLWNSSDAQSIKDRAKGVFSKKNNKRNAVFAALGLGIATGGGIMFFALIPLKVNHMVENMQKRYFSSSESAIERQTDRMLGRYIMKHVLPSYKSCGTTIDKKCTVGRIKSTNPVTGLYQTWADARLEQKLADKYGIEFQYDKKSDTWRLKTAGSAPDGDNIGREGERFNDVFNRADRSEMRAAIRSATADETHWKKTMYRYKVGRLLESKYGIKRCIIFCGTKDKANKKISDKKIAAKLYLTQRVIVPRSETVGVVLLCLLDTNCNPDETSPSDNDTAGGEPESDTDRDTRTTLDNLAKKFNSDPVKLKEAYKGISEKGMTNYMIEKALTKIGLQGVSSSVTKAVPIVGWISTVSDVITGVHKLGPTIKKLSYVVNSAAAVQTFMMYRTYADEVHTGNVDPVEVGSFNNSLGPGNNGEPTDPIKGGTAKAESAPLYQEIMKDQQAPTGGTALFTGGIVPKASAAERYSSVYKDDNYVCEDEDNKPPTGRVCDNEVLGQGSGALDDVTKFMDSPGVNIITKGAEAISGITGWAARTLGALFSNLPLVDNVTELISKAINPVMEAVVKEIVPNPFGTNMSGARTFDMMGAGADVAGNTYAHSGTGAQVISDEEVARTVNEQRNQERQIFESKSLYARIFNKESDASLVSRVAIAIPFGTDAKVHSGMATLLNPMNSIGNGFSSLFTGRANAAVSAQPDPFGVTQYGYPEGSIPDDPEQYWDDNCSDNAAYSYRKDNSWNESASSGARDEKTGMPINTEVNPCMLIKASVGAAGGALDTKNLTEDDLSILGTDSGATSSGSVISGDAQELAQEILDNDKISKVGRYVMEDFQNTAKGKPAYGDVTIDLNLLKFMADLGSTTPFTITSLSGAGSGHSDGSNHYFGKAVDFGCGFNEAKADEIGKKYNYMAGNERCDDGVDHSHFSDDGY